MASDGNSRQDEEEMEPLVEKFTMFSNSKRISIGGTKRESLSRRSSSMRESRKGKKNIRF